MTQGEADYVDQEDAKYGHAAQRFQPRDLFLCGTCGGIHCSDLRENQVVMLERARRVVSTSLVETFPQKGDQSPRFLWRVREFTIRISVRVDSQRATVVGLPAEIDVENGGQGAQVPQLETVMVTPVETARWINGGVRFLFVQGQEQVTVHSRAQFLQQRLDTTAPGPTAADAAKRLIRYGYNRLRPPRFDALRTPEER